MCTCKHLPSYIHVHVHVYNVNLALHLKKTLHVQCTTSPTCTCMFILLISNICTKCVYICMFIYRSCFLSALYSGTSCDCQIFKLSSSRVSTDGHLPRLTVPMKTLSAHQKYITSCHFFGSDQQVHVQCIYYYVEPDQM